LFFASSLYFQDLAFDATFLAGLDQAPFIKVHDTPEDAGRMLQPEAQSLYVDGEPQQVIGQVQRPRENVPLGKVDVIEDSTVAYSDAIRQTIAQRQHNVVATKRQAEDDEEHRQAKVKQRQIRNVRGSPGLLLQGIRLTRLQDLNDVSWMYPPPLDESPTPNETATTYIGQHQSLINTKHMYVTAVSCQVHECMLTCHQDKHHWLGRSIFFPGHASC
jgi:hypothetical protein